jgi:hypothetical protein|tara:strand:- start:2053 stop:2259 length:207 start_codon:yes stop_codon:yes gene_type:complete
MNDNKEPQKGKNKVVLSRISESEYDILMGLIDDRDHEFYARSISSCLKAIIGRYVHDETRKEPVQKNF